MRQWIHSNGKRLLRSLSALQARHSSIPTTPFLPNDTFDWVPTLESGTSAIRSELIPLMPHLEQIPAFHEISPDQARISTGDHWKTFVLVAFGQTINDNAALCPQTMALLGDIAHLENAWFSILAPGYHIPPHRGPTRALVRCHLGLLVPRPAEQCWLRVDTERRHWQEGECLLFDDTYEHEVQNNTDGYRTVLFLDVQRPMDRFGTLLNRTLLRALKASAYVKDPLRNLANNQGLQR
ncbi:MAG: aspartyl/asparaginyl beta-hydroxylase domain-containing protein [Pseudomonadales bacterium]